MPILEKEGVSLVLAPYVFGAAGELFLQDLTALEHGHVRAASYGASLRIGGTQAGTLSEAQPCSNLPARPEADGQPDDNRFNLVSSVRS